MSGDELQILNADSALKNFDGDKDFYNELLTDLEGLLPGYLNNLKKSVEEEDSKSINFNAHTIKGALRNIAAESSAALFAQIEMAGKQNEVATAKELCARVDAALGEFKEAVQKFRNENNLS